MVLQPLSGGREFGLRFLHQIRWATAQFNFKYFLRADDDYFICLSKLIHELEYRPKKNLLWAFFHCEGEGLVWPDEAWMVFTKDLIDRFLSQNKTKMYCHPHADQQIALWLNDIPSKVYFHDDRLHHDPPAAKIFKFNDMKNICDSYMGLHGAYGDKMLEYHRASNDGNKTTVPAIRRFETFCPHKTFDWTQMGTPYRFEPKLCNENPDWSLGHDSWKGREAGQGRR